MLAALGAAGAAGTVGAARIAGVRRSVSVDGAWYREAYDRQRTGYGRERNGPGPGLTRRWSTAIPDGVHQSSPVLVGGTVYVAGATPQRATQGTSRPVRFLGVDAASGTVETETVVTRYGGADTIGALVWDSLVYADGTFYLLAFDGLHALARDGTERWHRPLGGGPANSIQSRGHPVVVGDTVYAPTASTTSDTNAQEGLYALDTATGDVRWRYAVPTGEQGWVFPPAYADGTVYCALLDYGVVALDAATGRVAWEARLPMNGPPSIADGHVYASLDPSDPDGEAAESGIVALDGRTGERAWRSNGDGAWLGRPVAAAEGLVFHRERLSDLVCREAATGDERWRHEAAHPGLGTPAIADGTVYVLGRAASEGETGLLALDASSGDRTGFAATRYGSGSDAGVALGSELAFAATSTGTLEAFESCLAGAGGHCLH